MNRLNKAIVEIIYGKIIAHIDECNFNQLCCGCIEYEQDCLMLDEFEKWLMYGLDAKGKSKEINPFGWKSQMLLKS